MIRDPQLANFPGTNSVPETLAETVYLAPNVTSLGTVTSVSTTTGTQTFTFGTDFFSAYTSFKRVTFGTNSLGASAYAAVSALTSGDTLTLGPWASMDGNPTSGIVQTVEAYADVAYAQVTFSSVANNFDQDYSSADVGDTFSLIGTNTNVVTGNSSLVFSETYFEIGDLAPFVAADATVSSGTITLAGDYSSSISAGMPVVEKSYSTGPEIVQYELATGQWSNVVFPPKTTLVGVVDGTNSVSVNSTTDYVWGVMVFEIPSDWEEWIVQANYGFTTWPSSSGNNFGYARIQWMADGSAVTASTRLIINESNPYQQSGSSPYAWNSANFSGSRLDLGESYVGIPTAQPYPCTMSMARHSSKDAITPTTFCIFGLYDPRYAGAMGWAKAVVVVRRLK